MAQMDKYISEKGEKTNSKICRPESLYMTCPTLYRSNVKVRNLHTCKSQKEEIQFNKVVDSIRKNITKLPCTKVTYHMGTRRTMANRQIQDHVPIYNAEPI